MLAKKGDQVDAVITWVDGADPVLRHKKDAYLKFGGSPGSIKAGKIDARFSDNGELDACLKLLKENAAWLNRIYIVTDTQVPSIISEDSFFREKCEIVDHRVVFRGYEKYLPTFNSRSIETVIWRIPGLSEKFIYLNDDFFVVDAVNPDDFFQGDRVVLRGRWRYSPIANIALQTQLERAATRFISIFRKKTRTMHLLAQRQGANIAGYRWRYYRTQHVPHPMIKSKLVKFFSDRPGLIEENIKYRFRNEKQYWLIALSDHINIEEGNACFESDASSFSFNGEVDGEREVSRLEEAIRIGRVKFVTVAGLEKCRSQVRALLLSVISPQEDS